MAGREEPVRDGMDNLRVERYAGCNGLPAPVRHALAEAEARNVEQGEAWLTNLIASVFPADRGVALYALYGGEALLAVLPVRVVEDGGGRRVEALGNFYTSLYQPFVSPTLSADGLAFLLRRLVDENHPVASLRFSPMDVDGDVCKLLLAASCRAGLAAFPYFCFGNWYHRVREDWDAFRTARAGQVKSTIKRKGKEFAKAGGTLEIILGGERLDDGIRAYESVYSASWKVPEPYPEFTPGLIRFLAARGWLRLGVASIDGRAIAAQLWIVAFGKASIFKLAYHEEFKRYSAGTLLTAMLMERVFDVDKVGEIDYLIGDDPYKAEWMSERRERWGIVAYNPKTVRGQFGYLKEASGRLAKRMILGLSRLRRARRGN